MGTKLRVIKHSLNTSGPVGAEVGIKQSSPYLSTAWNPASVKCACQMQNPGGLPPVSADLRRSGDAFCTPLNPVGSLVDGDVLCLGAKAQADDGHNLRASEFGDLAPAAHGHPRNEHAAPHRGVLETPVLDSREHLFDQFCGCVFRPIGSQR